MHPSLFKCALLAMIVTKSFKNVIFLAKYSWKPTTALSNSALCRCYWISTHWSTAVEVFPPLSVSYPRCLLLHSTQPYTKQSCCGLDAVDPPELGTARKKVFKGQKIFGKGTFIEWLGLGGTWKIIQSQTPSYCTPLSQPLTTTFCCDLPTNCLPTKQSTIQTLISPI